MFYMPSSIKIVWNLSIEMAGICTKSQMPCTKCMRAKRATVVVLAQRLSKTQGKRERAEVLLRFARLFCQSFRHGLRRVTSRSLRRGFAAPPFHSSTWSPRFVRKAHLRCSCFTGLTTTCFRHWRRPSCALFLREKGGSRVLTKSQKNEALIRNDGVYVISGIFQDKRLRLRENAFPPRPLAANRQICKRLQIPLANRRFVNDQHLLSFREKGGFWEGQLHAGVALPKRLPLSPRGRTKRARCARSSAK